MINPVVKTECALVVRTPAFKTPELRVSDSEGKASVVAADTGGSTVSGSSIWGSCVTGVNIGRGVLDVGTNDEVVLKV